MPGLKRIGDFLRDEGVANTATRFALGTMGGTLAGKAMDAIVPGEGHEMEELGLFTGGWLMDHLLDIARQKKMAREGITPPGVNSQSRSEGTN